MRQGSRDGKVGPAAAEALDGLSRRNVQGVLIDRINFGQCFDEVGGVAFVSGQLGTNRMGVDRDAQNPFRVSSFEFVFGTKIVSLNRRRPATWDVNPKLAAFVSS